MRPRADIAFRDNPPTLSSPRMAVNGGTTMAATMVLAMLAALPMSPDGVRAHLVISAWSPGRNLIPFPDGQAVVS